MADTFRVGEKVDIHPATGVYHSGDTTGEIREIMDGGRTVRVRLDRSRMLVLMPVLNIVKRK